jgi:translation initiation factor 1
MSSDRLVYSSDKGSLRKEKKTSTYNPSSGPCKMRLETKGRGGKTVTVLWNFPWSEDEVRALMKDLQNRAACGATFKDGRIELQGDVRTRVQAYFQEKSLKLLGQ